MSSPPPDENHPLLPPSSHLATPSRSKLGARRYIPNGAGAAGGASGDRDAEGGGKSDKAKGKQRAVDASDDESGRNGHGNGSGNGGGAAANPGSPNKGKAKDETLEERGRAVTVIFSDDTGNLEVWVDDGESVGHVKEKIRHLRPSVAGLQLRLIHAGRLLTDGILLLPWLRSLEERVRRQAAGVGGDVGEVLREVGLTDAAGPTEEKGGKRGSVDGAHRRDGRDRKERDRRNQKVYLHVNVGGPLSPTGTSRRDSAPAEDEQPAAPRRRGFDTLLDAGLSPEDVANMRRQFYASRGEEVPDLGSGDVNDEHARALEEQWIEGDLTPATATTTVEGMYTSILNGLLIGFLVPLVPWFFFRDAPLPNFFDAEAEAEERARREEAALRAEEERQAAIHAAAMGIPLDAAGQASRNGTLAVSTGGGRSRSGTAEGGAPPSLGVPTSIGLTPTSPTPADLLAPPSAPSRTEASSRVSASPLVGGELVPSVVFSNRTQIGIVLGTIINVMFGALRFLSN